jgi:hypothetical protein
MLRLLLDEHITPELAIQVRAHEPALTVETLQGWQGGAYRQAADDVLMQAARHTQLTLGTFDQKTIVPLLKAWAEQGTAHAGVILVDERTFAPNDLGGLLRALLQPWRDHGTEEWQNRVVYLRKHS